MPEQNHSEQMRQERLVFYAEDVGKIDAVLDEFLKDSQARAALLVDRDGHLVTKKGSVGSFNPDSLAALVAGSFAATRELAKLLGESEFSVIFHQGKNEHIHIGLAADRSLLVILFDDRTTVGMVRVYCQELTNRIAEILKSAAEHRKAHGGGGGSGLDAAFGQAASDRLDEFFNQEKK
ncbi:MAG TPA: roadblock/LC7 domain-containing protein [Planctomycetota bacterium]|nr:roadblock/LC7 domain-containing protein [Planctomycetota bacterium]